ncbi:MAG: RsmF rRNA methyltransferase first C-terminal domain-containing protein [Bacillota bacterium]
MPNLPQDFLDKMRSLMGEAYEAFLKSYDDERYAGLRVNTLKISTEEFLRLSPFALDGVPWAEEGFYYGPEDRPGKHPYHEAGLYYIQEPSAMAVGTLLNPQPGERILDLSAAPGGKATHIAAKMDGTGLLVANEIHPSRAKILSQNIERMGVKNCVVTNEPPERLQDRFDNFFHRILVDAPCSGEGMFRKDEAARSEWSLEHVKHCAERQLYILEAADKMLMAEGYLVYSTCTFSPEENERVIDQFIQRHPEYEIQKVKGYEGFSPGRAEWSIGNSDKMGRTVRLWPHIARGEGHYIAVLQKTEGKSFKRTKLTIRKLDKKELKEYDAFCKKFLKASYEGQFIMYGEQLYIIPEEIGALDNLRVLRPGLHLGALKKNRFEPSHALALALQHQEVKNNVFLTATSTEVLDYLKGNVFETEGADGWNLVNVDGYSLGWCKIANGIVKNHYPKGLRWLGG